MSVRAAGRELLRQQVFNPNRAKRPSSRGAPMFLQTAITPRSGTRRRQRESTQSPTFEHNLELDTGHHSDNRPSREVNSHTDDDDEEEEAQGEGGAAVAKDNDDDEDDEDDEDDDESMEDA